MNAHAHHMSPAEKKKLYMKVFFALFVITICEVGATQLPFAKIVRDSVIVLLACTKAGAVGYYYMHLSHETKWLRIVACLPLFMLMYTAVLIPDTARSRPTSIYLPENPRILPPSSHELEKMGAEASEHGEHVAPDAVPEAVGFPAPGTPTSGSVANAGDTGLANSDPDSSNAKPTLNPIAPSETPNKGVPGTPVTNEGQPAAAAPAAGGGSVDDWK